jgi:CheY-like chemotaxis protein
VIVAKDRAQAWSILWQEHPPELLILDWVMPGIDGWELCRRIRKQRMSHLSAAAAALVKLIPEIFAA